MRCKLWELKGSIEDGIANLERALSDLTEDDACDEWPAMRETAEKIEAVLKEARKLLPLHAELEQAIKDDDDLADRFEASSY